VTPDELMERVAARRDELAQTIVDRLRVELVSYRLVEGEPEYDDALRFTRASIDGLRSEQVSDEELRRTHTMAQSLTEHGVSLSAIQRSGRVFGSAVWNAIREATRTPEEGDAALELGSRVWRHVDVISTAAAHAYLDEVTDRGLLGRTLMDALLTGRGETEFAHRLARTLHLRLGTGHIVIVVRGDGVPVEDVDARPLATRVALDHIVDAARVHLRPAAGTILLGIRLGDLVALYPVADADEVRRVRGDLVELAAAVTVDVGIGMSGYHDRLPDLSIALEEAREAAAIAFGAGIRGRAVALEDVIVDHMLRSSAHAQRLLDRTLRPLQEYDAAHRAELVETLRAYIATGTNLAKSARMLTVHANTVVYRLRRIRELTGRDPQATDELMVLYLALKLDELR
jgi:sugar diacid utilization regulator